MPRKTYSPRLGRRGHQELNASRLQAELKNTRKKEKRDGSGNR